MYNFNRNLNQNSYYIILKESKTGTKTLIIIFIGQERKSKKQNKN